MADNDILDERDINVRLKVYELRMMMEALKNHPWKFAHPVLMKCDAQLQRFDQIERERESRKMKDIHNQKKAEIDALAMKKADSMFKIKVDKLKEKEKKKSKRQKKSRR